MDNNYKGLISCGIVKKSVDESNLVGVFRGKTIWLVFENTHYEDNMKLEFPNEFFINSMAVPIYTITKNRKKVSYMLPRLTKKKKDKYLFIPSLKGQGARRYYIFDVDKNYKIKKDAKIWFCMNSDMSDL